MGRPGSGSRAGRTGPRGGVPLGCGALQGQLEQRLRPGWAASPTPAFERRRALLPVLRREQCPDLVLHVEGLLVPPAHGDPAAVGPDGQGGLAEVPVGLGQVEEGPGVVGCVGQRPLQEASVAHELVRRASRRRRGAR